MSWVYKALVMCLMQAPTNMIILLGLLLSWKSQQTSNVMLARLKTAFATGFNFKVSISHWFPFGRTDLCKDSPVFNSLVHDPLSQCIHHWGVFFQHFLEFFEQ